VSSTKQSNNIYNFGHGNNTSIEKYFNVPEELHDLKELSSHEMWRVTGEDHFRAECGFILGSRNTLSMDNIERRIAKRTGEEYVPDISKLHQKYYYDMDKFGDKICGLINWYFNLSPMSGEIKPYTLYLTPQCGEHKRHQEILEKFAEINKGYVYEDE